MTEPLSWSARAIWRLLSKPWVKYHFIIGQFDRETPGVPDVDIKRYLDPKNCVVYSITEQADGAFETKSTISEMPEWNQTSCFKVRPQSRGSPGRGWSGLVCLKSEGQLQLPRAIIGIFSWAKGPR